MEVLTPFISNIYLNRARNSNLDSYTVYCSHVYCNQGWVRFCLSDFFAEDFAILNPEDFAKVLKLTHRALRDYLYENGVCVRHVRTVKISAVLYQAVDKELGWPEEEPNRINLCKAAGSSQTGELQKQPRPRARAYTCTTSTSLANPGPRTTLEYPTSPLAV